MTKDKYEDYQYRNLITPTGSAANLVSEPDRYQRAANKGNQLKTQRQNSLEKRNNHANFDIDDD